MSHLYNDIFSWILYPGERIDVQMGMELADFCYCIRETFLFLSPFWQRKIKKSQHFLLILLLVKCRKLISPAWSNTIALRKIYDDFCDFKVSSWGVSPLDYI